MLLRSLQKDFLKAETRWAADKPKQSRAVPQGAGSAPKRVTEGKQGKYGRDGVLWKHPAEGHLYEDAVASRQQRRLCVRWSSGPAIKAGRG